MVFIKISKYVLTEFIDAVTGIKPDSVTFSLMINACAKVKTTYKHKHSQFSLCDALFLLLFLSLFFGIIFIYVTFYNSLYLC